MQRLAIPSKTARSRPGLEADLRGAIRKHRLCAVSLGAGEQLAAVLPVSSGFNKDSHLYSLLQPSPVSNLSQGTLQIYYSFVVSKYSDGF